MIKNETITKLYKKKVVKGNVCFDETYITNHSNEITIECKQDKIQYFNEKIERLSVNISEYEAKKAQLISEISEMKKL